MAEVTLSAGRPPWTVIALLLAALVVAGAGLAAVAVETMALAERDARRAALAEANPTTAPEATINAAESYLAARVRRPDRGHLLWALGRYEAAVRRYVALRVGRDDAAAEAAITRYRESRRAALIAIGDDKGAAR